MMRGRTRTRGPIALPTVRIHVNADGAPTVTVDKEPYTLSPSFGRDQVRGLLQDLADELGPIRVKITESDGEKYIDIQTPSDPDPTPRQAARTRPETPRIRGRFDSEEGVMVAVVVARRTAQTDGTVTVRLPPAFLQRYGDDVVLIGQTTKTSATLTGGGEGVAP